MDFCFFVQGQTGSDLRIDLKWEFKAEFLVPFKGLCVLG